MVKRHAVSICLAFILLLFTGCGDPPEMIVKEYMAGIMNGDLLAAKTLCTGPAFVAARDAEHGTTARAKFHRELLTSWPEISHLAEYKVLEVMGKDAEVQVSVKGQHVATFRLEKVNGQWKICNAPYPGLVWGTVAKVLDS